MSLPSTDISTDLVKATIGLSSDDVGTLCTAAKTGGSGGYAFSITNNGGAITDGKLIDGASPYFNIWSTYAPGYWKLPVDPSNPVYYQLKRYELTNEYAFILDSFGGYNHAANSPSIAGGSSDMSVQTSYPTQVAISTYCNLGSYDWTTLGASKCRIDIFKNGVRVGHSDPVNVAQDTTLMFNDILFYEDLRYSGTITYILYIQLLNESGNIIGRLPVSSTYTLTVQSSTTHANVFNVNVTIPVSGSWSAMQSAYGYFYRTFTPDEDFTADPTITLQSIYYVLYNSNGTVNSSLNVTSFGSNDGPTAIYNEKAGNSYIFKADSSRLTPNTALGQWVEVTMTFNS